MPEQSEANPSGTIEEFSRRLSASLTEGKFVRLILSHPRPEAGRGPSRVLGRCVELKGVPHLSITLRFKQSDQVKNLPLPESAAYVMGWLETTFQNALLCTTTADWQLTLATNRRPRLIRHPPSSTTAPDRRHDQPRSRTLDDTAQDWLRGLGVTDARGQVRPGMADKHAQIHRYLEIVSHLAEEAGWTDTAPSSADPAKPRILVDMGCGKGYLTFGLWHLWRRVWQLPVQVLGVETRPELVNQTNRLAKSIGADDLRFVAGTIDAAILPAADALIALHACDTATDDAIRRGIDSGAQLIIVAPCCHKEVRPQLEHPEPLKRVLEHGIMEERMAEWVTDGLRALFLEWAGYRTKLFEFVSVDHTAKNLMLAAFRQQPPFADPAAKARIVDLKTYFGIRAHRLDPLLERSNSPG